jgi:hypothetical protein
VCLRFAFFGFLPAITPKASKAFRAKKVSFAALSRRFGVQAARRVVKES